MQIQEMTSPSVPTSSTLLCSPNKRGQISEVCVGGPSETCLDALEAAAGAGAVKINLWYVPTMQDILGWIFWPLAFLMGVPAKDCMHIGQLRDKDHHQRASSSEMLEMLKDPAINLSHRSQVIATYALCGCNLRSIAIQIGGIGGIAPSRRKIF